MISTSVSKLIRSLHHKKFRDQHRLYVVEGEKMVRELLEERSREGHQVQQLYANATWLDQNMKQIRHKGTRFTEASTAELKKVSSQVTPQPVLALVSIPDSLPGLEALLHSTVLAFESIRDPGNLGTIIRTADWFGISHIVCTPDSVDVFNPKVVQSTMGAIIRVKVHYRDLERLLEEPLLKDKPVYGTFMDGDNIFESAILSYPLILFGNESHGLTSKYDAHIHRRLSIPSFSRGGKGSESLNIASSVAVICSEVSRRG